MATATSNSIALDDDQRPTRPIVRSHDATRVIPLVGRILFSAIFVLSAPKHFTPALVNAAASHGVPFPSLAVPLAGVFVAAGGLSVLFGYKAKVGGWLLVIFLVPVTLYMHRFWGLADAHEAQMQMMNFTKNTALVGGALLVAYFGAGPISADARIARMHVRMLADEGAE